MSIDAVLGKVRWTPRMADLGVHSVVIRATDGQGGFATQTYDLTVRASNLAPSMVSVPSTRAAVGEDYWYAVRANDPEGDLVRFALVTAPDGMAMDPESGLIEWIPALDQVGTHAVRIEAADTAGATGTQEYEVVVAAESANGNPVITSTPPFLAQVGVEYRYTVTAIDPDGDAVTFALLTHPGGMSINALSGEVRWVPSVGDIGRHDIAIGAADPFGAGGSQTYALQVIADNAGPAILSSAVQLVQAGSVYRYDVVARDPDGDALSYAVNGPAGMRINGLGQVVWPITLEHAGIHRVSITVSDPMGASVTQTYDLLVDADTTPPRVFLAYASDRLPVGTILDIAASATDNVGVTSLVVTFGGMVVPLDSRGRASLLLRFPGEFEIRALATDAAGNIGEDGFVLTVVDVPFDPDAPVVSIITPADDAVLTAPVDVIGTATDANLVSYTLSIAPVGSDAFRVIAHGTESVENGVLGRLDTSLLANDAYTLRLEARDAASSSSSEIVVYVTGDLKVGNFTLSFVDLSIPVSGLPITVGRTYDTLNASRSSDFGYGWRLEFRDTNLRNNLPPRTVEEVEFGMYPAFTDRTRVFVTLPGGRRQGFTFKPVPVRGFAGSFWAFYKPAFHPDPGVTSSLTVEDGPGVVLKYNNLLNEAAARRGG